MIWTDEMDEMILSLRKQGMTFLAIAGVMNWSGYSFSRSAIQGRLARLDRWSGAADLKKVLPVKLTKPLGVPAELLDLDPLGCKWGVAEDESNLHRHIFCNKHRHDKQPYCWEHYRRSVGMRHT